MGERIYSHPQTDYSVLSELFSVARHVAQSVHVYLPITNHPVRIEVAIQWNLIPETILLTSSPRWGVSIYQNLLNLSSLCMCTWIYKCVCVCVCVYFTLKYHWLFLYSCLLSCFYYSPFENVISRSLSKHRKSTPFLSSFVCFFRRTRKCWCRP